MWILEPMEISDVSDMILSSVELDDLLRLRQVSKGAKLIADSRLRRLHKSLFKGNTEEDMKIVISELKDCIIKKYWVFTENIADSTSDYIFYGTKDEAMQQWAMIKLDKSSLDLHDYVSDISDGVNTLRDYILALYIFLDDNRYGYEDEDFKYLFELDINIESPLEDSVIERFMKEEKNKIMSMTDFLEKGYWPEVYGAINIYRIKKPIPFGHDLQVQNIDNYIVKAERENYDKNYDPFPY